MQVVLVISSSSRRSKGHIGFKIGGNRGKGLMSRYGNAFFFYHKEASSTSEVLCQYSCDSNESILYMFKFLHQNALPDSCTSMIREGLGVGNSLF